ncbi:MAG: glycine--tRNA ligase [Ardenticatenaceae bacterium]|nr:glycine--tRNA ligase [Ardenticatenaceae bacterium]
MSEELTLETLVALAKRRGFVYPTSEIYGGLASSYDYGPLGVELLRNIRSLWWREMVNKRFDMVGIDSQILLHPQTWVASGHVSSFTDPLVEDKVTNQRYRADHLIEAWIAQNAGVDDVVVEELTVPEMAEFIAKHQITSPDGNEVTPPREFNILFETAIGVIAGEKSKVYLRGETAQGIFSNFKQVLDSTRVKLPFGIAQIGKSFRNEITTGQFVFRTLEFEQAEIEYFFDPRETDWRDLFAQWQAAMWSFVVDKLGVNPDNLRWRQHTDKERSHYSEDTYDLDYNFPFGFKELWGIAYRTDYDLRQHIEHSGKKLEYLNQTSGERFVPHVIEPALGINRVFLMLLADAYWEDTANNRTVLRFKPSLAPYKVAVFPLLKNKPDLVAKAEAIFADLTDHFATTWDERGNIGKRYYYQDEIGTPFCVTVDFDTLADNTVTVRDRDTTEQVRVNVDQLVTYLREQIG